MALVTNGCLGGVNIWSKQLAVISWSFCNNSRLAKTFCRYCTLYICLWRKLKRYQVRGSCGNRSLVIDRLIGRSTRLRQWAMTTVYAADFAFFLPSCLPYSLLLFGGCDAVVVCRRPEGTEIKKINWILLVKNGIMDPTVMVWEIRILIV